MKKLSQRDVKQEIQNALNLKLQEIDKLINEQLVQMQNIIAQDKTNEQKNAEIMPLVENMKSEIEKHIQEASGQMKVIVPPTIEQAAQDKVPALRRENLDYGSRKIASGPHRIVWEEYELFGNTSISISVLDLGTQESSKPKEFSGNIAEIKPEAEDYVMQLRKKYPGAQVQRNG